MVWIVLKECGSLRPQIELLADSYTFDEVRAIAESYRKPGNTQGLPWTVSVLEPAMANNDESLWRMPPIGWSGVMTDVMTDALVVEPNEPMATTTVGLKIDKPTEG